MAPPCMYETVSMDERSLESDEAKNKMPFGAFLRRCTSNIMAISKQAVPSYFKQKPRLAVSLAACSVALLALFFLATARDDERRGRQFRSRELQRTPPIVFMGPVDGLSGYGAESRSFAIGLARRHPHMAVRHFGQKYKGDKIASRARDGLSNEDRALLNSCMDNQILEPRQPGLNICNSPPEKWFTPNAFGVKLGCPPQQDSDTESINVGRTMFETDGLPRHWLQPILGMDELWVPSHFAARVFAKHGITPERLFILHEGTDVELFDGDLSKQRSPHPLPPVPPSASSGSGLKNGTSNTMTTFLSIGKWEGRKGMDVLVRAFCLEFSSDESVRLVIKTEGFMHTDPHTALPDLVSRECGPKSAGATGRVVLLDDWIPDKDLPSLYSAVDAFVLASRGEGWGRPQSEAMTMGLPTIATDWGGATEYLSDRVALPISAVPRDVSPEDKATLAGSKSKTAALENHKWASPSVSHLRNQMRWVFRNPEAAKTLGDRARDTMRDLFSTVAIQGVLDEHVERLLQHAKQISASKPSRRGNDLGGGNVEGASVRWEPHRRPVVLHGPVLGVGDHSNDARQVLLSTTIWTLDRNLAAVSNRSIQPPEHSLVVAARDFGDMRDESIEAELAFSEREMIGLSMQADFSPRPVISMCLGSPDGWFRRRRVTARRRKNLDGGVATSVNADNDGRGVSEQQFMCPPSDAYYFASTSLARTTWGTNKLPKTWVERLNRFDRVWVSTPFDMSTFASSGVEQDRLVKIPEAIDTEGTFAPTTDHSSMAHQRHERSRLLSALAPMVLSSRNLDDRLAFACSAPLSECLNDRTNDESVTEVWRCCFDPKCNRTSTPCHSSGDVTAGNDSELRCTCPRGHIPSVGFRDLRLTNERRRSDVDSIVDKRPSSRKSSDWFSNGNEDHHNDREGSFSQQNAEAAYNDATDSVPIEGKSPRPTSDEPFVFLGMGTWNARSGLDLLVDAYVAEFSQSDKAILLLAVAGGRAGGEAARDAVRGAFARRELRQRGFRKEKSNVDQMAPPQLVVIPFDEALGGENDSRRARLLEAADAFVSTRRGGWFDRFAAEAMSVGIALVASDHSGSTDLWGDEGDALGWPVRTSMRIVKATEKVEVFGDRNNGAEAGLPHVWPVPDLEHVQKRMRQVFNAGHEERKRIGLVAREHARQTFSSEVVYPSIKAQLDDITPSFPSSK